MKNINENAASTKADKNISERLNSKINKYVQNEFNKYCERLYLHTQNTDKNIEPTLDAVYQLLSIVGEHKDRLKNPICLFNIAKLQVDAVIKKGRPYNLHDVENLKAALSHLEQIRSTVSKSEIPYKYYTINELELLTAKIYTLLHTIPGESVDWEKPKKHITQAVTNIGYKSNTDEETIRMDFLRFLIKQGCFENMLNSLQSYGKEKNDYITKSIKDSNTLFSFCISVAVPIAAPISIPIFLGTLVTATVNGIIDSTTRVQISPEAQLQLFCHLSAISKKDEFTKQTILEAIYESYTNKDATFFKRSNASVELGNQLNDTELTISQKWEYIVDYATDVSKNNGKALFLKINEVLIKKLGVIPIPVQNNSNHTLENSDEDGFYMI